MGYCLTHNQNYDERYGGFCYQCKDVTNVKIVSTNTIELDCDRTLKGELNSNYSQSDEIIDDIKEVVQSWFKCNDDLTHRECDILNSVVKCYKM
jgi:hypothetical protein